MSWAYTKNVRLYETLFNFDAYEEKQIVSAFLVKQTRSLPKQTNRIFLITDVNWIFIFFNYFSSVSHFLYRKAKTDFNPAQFALNKYGTMTSPRGIPLEDYLSSTWLRWSRAEGAIFGWLSH